MKIYFHTTALDTLEEHISIPTSSGLLKTSISDDPVKTLKTLYFPKNAMEIDPIPHPNAFRSVSSIENVIFRFYFT